MSAKKNLHVYDGCSEKLAMLQSSSPSPQPLLSLFQPQRRSLKGVLNVLYIVIVRNLNHGVFAILYFERKPRIQSLYRQIVLCEQSASIFYYRDNNSTNNRNQCTVTHRIPISIIQHSIDLLFAISRHQPVPTVRLVIPLCDELPIFVQDFINNLLPIDFPFTREMF